MGYRCDERQSGEDAESSPSVRSRRALRASQRSVAGWAPRIAWRPVPELPAMAAWRHRGARVGFQVLFLRRERGWYQLDGYSTAVQEGEAWGIRYALTLDDRWVTRSAHVVGQSDLGAHEVRLEA